MLKIMTDSGSRFDTHCNKITIECLKKVTGGLTGKTRALLPRPEVRV